MDSDYPCPAPVFADQGSNALIIGYAATSTSAMAIFRDYFSGTGAFPTHAIMVAPERRGEGPVPGWAPLLTDE